MVGKSTFNNNNVKQKLSFVCNVMFDAIGSGNKMLVVDGKSNVTSLKIEKHMTQTQQELQSQQLDYYKIKLCESMQLTVNTFMKTSSSSSIFNTQWKL